LRAALAALPAAARKDGLSKMVEHEIESDPADPVRRVTGQLSVDAPVDRVWSIVTDVEQMPGIHPNMLSAQWLDGASGAGLGARFASKHVHEEFGVWHAISRIVDFRPSRSIAWTIEGTVAPPTVCRFDLIPDPDPDPDSGQGRTLLRQTYFYDTRPGAPPPIEQARTAIRDPHDHRRSTDGCLDVCW
jgi:uncharacterized membrane protein